MKESILPQIVNEKLDNGEQFIAKHPNKLKYIDVGSTLGSFRAKEERRSHLPCSLFKSDS